MLGDIANAERTVQASDGDAKTVRIAEKAENLRQLDRTFFLQLGWHPHASVKHFNRCLNYPPARAISRPAARGSMPNNEIRGY
jgi:DNA-binding transcriptional regulator WhiA